MERTLSIIKPDGVAKGLIGEVIRRFEGAGLKIIAMKMIHLSRKEAEGFYSVHRDKGFYDSLTNFMSSGPCVAMILEGPQAIARNRELMGATNPKDAAAGTIRREYASSIERNIVHGSDGPETAAFEMGFFFNALEIFEY
jgi:nucleoside-diphosphate kinase